MIKSWLRSVEQVMLASVDSQTRVVGVISPESGAGVSTLCRMVAERRAHTGAKTLLVDLTQAIGENDIGEGGWAPGDGAAQMIQRDENGYEILSVRPTSTTRPLFNNVDTLRTMLADELKDYDMIVVDLPPILDQNEDLINPLAAARACDAVVMVSMPGKLTHQRLKQSVSTIGAAGIQLGGNVLNDHHNPTLGRELAGLARGLARIAPRIGNFLERKLMLSQFLNSRP